MIDNKEINEILMKLEGLEDENLAVLLLKEFNDATKVLGLLLMNQNQSLSHSEWKDECDEASAKVDLIVKKIDELT